MVKMAAAAVTKKQAQVSLIRLMVLPSFPSPFDDVIAGGLEKAKNLAGKFSARFRLRLARRSFKNISPARQAQSPQARVADFMRT
jgi:hypothetical protein